MRKSIRIAPIKLLKLILLLGLTSDAPANWLKPFGSIGCRWRGWARASSLSLDAAGTSQTALDAFNETGREPPGAASFAGSGAPANVSVVRSIIRSGEQKPGNDATSGSLAIQRLSSSPPPSARRRQDEGPEGVGQPAAGNHRHQLGASNHRTQPIESYANYNGSGAALQLPPSGAGSPAPETGDFNFSLTPAALATVNSLLNREHHNDFGPPSATPAVSAGHQGLERLLRLELNNEQFRPSDYKRGGDIQQRSSPLNVVPANHRTAAQVPSMRSSLGARDDLPGQMLSQLELDLLGASTGFQDTANLLQSNNNHQSTPSPSPASNSAPLNARLIQNLTAGLFPVGSISNATLSLLSELLSKTKQTADQSLHSPNNSAALAPPISQRQPNYLETLLGDHRFSSMLGHLVASGASAQASAPSVNQFGLREPTYSPAAFHQQHLASGQAGANRPWLVSPSAGGGGGGSSKFETGQIIVGTRAQAASPPRSKSSNVYNTYLPFRTPGTRGATRPQQQQQQQGPATNGQLINMAATLYDNYLDHSYRPPLVATSKQRPQQQHWTPRGSHSGQQQYQFVQQHSTNNQNHLDKIVYHSTPFRPSIASPPQQQQQQLPHQSTGLNGQNSNQQQQQSYSRPESEADSKSMIYAALGNDNANGHARPEFGTNSSLRSPGKQQAAAMFEQQPHRPESDFDSVYERIQGGAEKPSASNQTAASLNSQQSTTGPGGAGGGAKQAPGSERGAGGLQQLLAGSLTSPQLLLDLYERAIDSQIQEAIYGDHSQHPQQLSSALLGATDTTAPSSPQTIAASASSHSSWPPFEDGALFGPPGASKASASSGPVALGYDGERQQSSASTTAGQATLDPLVSALQGLPTFSASDLQPLLPPSPSPSAELATYWLAPPQLPAISLNAAGVQMADSASDTPPLAALASHMFGPLAVTPAPNFGQLLGEGAQTSDLSATPAQLYDKWIPSQNNWLLHTQQQQTLHPGPLQSSSAGSNQNVQNQIGGGGGGLSLPALVAKLQASQLSSILASPLAHLQASLPRYRHTKPKQQQQQQHQSAKHDNNQGAHSASVQAALMQAQLGNEPLMAEHSSAQPALVRAKLARPGAGSSNQQATTLLGLSGLASGLAGGGGVSPLVWRNLLGPINWARKQASGHGGASSGGGQASQLPEISYGSQALAHHCQLACKPTGAQQGSRQQQLSPLALAQAIWNTSKSKSSSSSNNNTPFSQPLQAGSQFQPVGLASSLQAMGALEASNGDELRGRRPVWPKIKILKLPVAFYDNSAPSSGTAAADRAQGGPQGESGTASSLSLVPVPLQPGPTASLLASLSCPLHGLQLVPPAGLLGGQQALSASHLMPHHSNRNQHQQTFKPTVAQPPAFSYPPADQMEPLSSGRPLNGLTTPTGAPGDASKPAPIRDFTDINQPNDLQVAPSTRTNTYAAPATRTATSATATTTPLDQQTVSSKTTTT